MLEKILGIYNKSYQNEISLHYTSLHIGMAKRKSSDTNKLWQECRETGSFIKCCWECKIVEPPEKQFVSFYKTKHVLL